MEIKSVGVGKLVGWRDPDEERIWRRLNKSREERVKVTDLGEAIEKFVKSGIYVVFGGMGHIRAPIAAVHEIIRRKRCGFIFGAKVGTFDLDLLLAAKCVRDLEVTYAFGHEIRGLSSLARRMYGRGEINILAEWSSASYEWRLKAGAMGIPFIPTRVLLGSDTFKRSSGLIVEDPFSRKPIVLLPSLNPDLAIIHVHKADVYGNAIIEGPVFSDIELAMASRRVIITAEEVVDKKIKGGCGDNFIPHFLVDAVSEVPYGAHPTNMPYRYYFDEEHISLWLELSKTDEGVFKYLEKYIYGVRSHKEYIDLVGGLKKMRILERIENEGLSGGGKT